MSLGITKWLESYKTKKPIKIDGHRDRQTAREAHRHFLGSYKWVGHKFSDLSLCVKGPCHTSGHTRQVHPIITALLCQVASINQAASCVSSQCPHLQPLAYPQCSLIKLCVGSQSMSLNICGTSDASVHRTSQMARKARSDCIMTTCENCVAHHLVADELPP